MFTARTVVWAVKLVAQRAFKTSLANTFARGGVACPAEGIALAGTLFAICTGKAILADTLSLLALLITITGGFVTSHHLLLHRCGCTSTF
mgnify:CR=1 FL=1